MIQTTQSEDLGSHSRTVDNGLRAGGSPNSLYLGNLHGNLDDCLEAFNNYRIAGNCGKCKFSWALITKVYREYGLHFDT